MGDDSSQIAQDFSLENLPEWTNVRDLLAAIEEQLGSQVRDQIEEALDRDEDEVINVRGLLADIQEELGGSYFDSILQDDQGESGLTSQEDSRGWWIKRKNWEPGCLQNTWRCLPILQAMWPFDPFLFLLLLLLECHLQAEASIRSPAAWIPLNLVIGKLLWTQYKLVLVLVYRLQDGTEL